MTSAPTPQPAPPARPMAEPALAPFVRPLGLIGAIRSEWIKASSLRSIRWSIAVSVVLGIGLSYLMGLGFRDWIGSSPAEHAEYIRNITSFPATFMVLVFAVLGVFVFSSEYSSGMILSTLTAVPRRGFVITAKAIVLTVIAGIAAGVNVFVGALLGSMLVPGSGSQIFTAAVLSSMLGTVFYLVAIALIAFALAGILRSTAGSITVTVTLIFVIPTAVQIIAGLTEWNWMAQLHNYLPTVLGSTLGDGTEAGDAAAMTAVGSVHFPDYWESMAALAGWVTVPMALAAAVFFRRDAK